MESAIKQPAFTRSISESKSVTVEGKFTAFCNSLEGSRILLLTFMVLIQGCIFVPATLLISSFIDLGLQGVSVGVLAAGTVGVLVSNMSELPIKAIITIFLLSTVTTISLLAVHLLSI